MYTLSNYLQKNISTNIIEEGLFKEAISLVNLKSMNSSHLLEGILDMYDYIVDEDDIKLFFQDMPTKEVFLWKNLYELYKKGIWTIFDVDCSLDDIRGRAENIEDDSDNQRSKPYRKSNDDVIKFIRESFNGQYGVLIKVTPAFRRNLRNLINQSRNSKLDIKPSAPESMMVIQDDVKKKVFILTINRVTGLFKRILRATDKKYLEYAFSKLGE